MSDGDQGSFFPSAWREPVVLGRKIAGPTVSRRPGGFTEGSSQPAIPAADRAANPLARRLFVARTNSGPGTQMMFIRKNGHIHTDFGEDRLNRDPIQAGNGVQTFEVRPR